jgi:uncharacterized protein YbgA (DUF1722 family)/uncharacterized protein YbbK (DUF523 family)
MSAPRDERAPAASAGAGAPRIPVGISACLLGSAVRFDGGHKRNAYVVDVLGRAFDWQPVCPEIGIGLGSPRESLRLVASPGGPRLVAPRSGSDHTAAMREHSAAEIARLAALPVRGFVLKKDSPSCGLERVRVYDGGGTPARTGTGIFAAELRRALPDLPVEEEGRLQDPALRESFVTRVFTFDRWLALEAAGPRPRDLVAFHAAHKLLLLAHDPAGARALGRLVAAQAARPFAKVLGDYRRGLMAALARPASSRRHVDALQHLVGFLRPALSGAERRAILEVVEDYRRGWAPLAAPHALVRHSLRRAGHPWAEAQVYLQPHPKELAAWA